MGGGAGDQHWYSVNIKLTELMMQNIIEEISNSHVLLPPVAICSN
jgi:hypothetical protein